MISIRGYIFKWILRLWEWDKKRKQQWDLTSALLIEFLDIVDQSDLKRLDIRRHSSITMDTIHKTAYGLVSDLDLFMYNLDRLEYVDKTLNSRIDLNIPDVKLTEYLVDQFDRPVSASAVLSLLLEFVETASFKISEIGSEPRRQYYERKIYPLYKNIWAITEACAQINWR